MTKQIRDISLFALLILCTRIPFLFDGYGSEEDAWAIPLVVERIATSGIYEASRLPGHPVQELIYSAVWNSGSIFFNLLTALISTLGILAFTLLLKNLNIKNAYWCGLALAFTPIVYINSSNAMDYTWAMAFILISGFYISKKNILLAGGMLALAIGCRITSGAMFLPYAILLWEISSKEERQKNVLLFLSFGFLFSLIVMSPVLVVYGKSFFTYYEHFPLPGLTKNVYKGTVAVWGLPACIALLYYGFSILRKRKVEQVIFFDNKPISGTLLYISSIVILLYSISFIRLPLKAAFIIPICPFLILMFALLLKEKSFKILTLSFVFSCFFFGINLADPQRGSGQSWAAKTFDLAGDKIVFDPLMGLVLADQNKRVLRTSFSKKILHYTQTLKDKTVILAGWWNADLLVLSREFPNKNVTIKHYIDESELKFLTLQNFKIFYIEDQNRYNDLRFNQKVTDHYAKKLPIN